MFGRSKSDRPSTMLTEQFYQLPDFSKTEAQLSFAFPKKPEDLKTFLDDSTKKGKAFKQGMRAVLQDIKDWAIKHGFDTKALDEFTEKYLDYSGTNDEVNITNFPLYQQGFRAIANVGVLLNNDKIPIDKRKDTLRNMFNDIALCGPGTFTNAANTYLELASFIGISEKFLNWRRKLAQQKVLELIKPFGIRTGMEIHYVNAVLNTYSDSLSIPWTEDRYISMCNQGRLDRLNQNFEKTFYLSATELVNSLIDELYVDFTAKPLTPSNYESVLKQLEQALTSYGQEPSDDIIYKRESIVSLDDDDVPFPSWKTKAILAYSVIRRLQSSGFFKDAAPAVMKLNSHADIKSISYSEHAVYSVVVSKGATKEETPFEIYFVETLAGQNQDKIDELLSLFKPDVNLPTEYLANRCADTMHEYLQSKEFNLLDTPSKIRIRQQFVATNIKILTPDELLIRYAQADDESKQYYLTYDEFIPTAIAAIKCKTNIFELVRLMGHFVELPTEFQAACIQQVNMLIKHKYELFDLFNNLSITEFDQFTPLLAHNARLQSMLLDLQKILRLRENKRATILFALGDANKLLIQKLKDYKLLLNMLPKRDQILYRAYMEKMAKSDPRLAEIVFAHKKVQTALAKITAKKDLVKIIKEIRVTPNSTDLIKPFAQKVKALNFSFADEVALIYALPKEHRSEFFEHVMDDLANKADTENKIVKLLQLSHYHARDSARTMPSIVKQINQSKAKPAKNKLRLDALYRASGKEEKKLVIESYIKNPKAFKKLNSEEVCLVLDAIPKNMRTYFLITANLQNEHNGRYFSTSEQANILDCLPLSDRTKYFKSFNSEYKLIIAKELEYALSKWHLDRRYQAQVRIFIGQFRISDLGEVWDDIQKANPAFNYSKYIFTFFKVISDDKHKQFADEEKKLIDKFMPQIKQCNQTIYQLTANVLSQLNAKNISYLLDQYTNVELHSLFKTSKEKNTIAKDAIQWFHLNENKTRSTIVIRAMLGELEKPVNNNKSRLFQHPASDKKLKVAYETLLDAIKNDNPVDVLEYNKKHPELFTSSPLQDIYQWFMKPYKAQLKAQPQQKT